MLVKRTPSTQLYIEGPPLLNSQAYKKLCFRTRQEIPPTGQLGIDKLLLPSGSAQVPEGCCEDCAQKNAPSVKGANTGLINMLSPTH